MKARRFALEIDFVRRRRSAPWAGRLALALAVAVAADLGHSYATLRRSMGEAETRLAQLPAQARGAAQKASPEEIAAARETLERLAMPWQELLAALEAAASKDVALLAIEPDPGSGTVRISGDGKDYPAALAYVASLGRVEALSRVELVRHEAKKNAVGFTVSARWGSR